MIRIGKPQIESKDGKTILKAFVTNEAENFNDWLWYETDNEYGVYFCDETADAFVLPMIQRAVKTHQDIYVDSPISEKLCHNLNDSVFYALGKAFEKKTGKRQGETVKIHCDNLVTLNYAPKAVGTGCSLGVDSFAVLKQYFFNNVYPSYKTTHLALFNSGAFGSTDADGARKSFYKDTERVRKFAESIGLPFVWVDSNVRSLYLEMNFNSCHSYLNMGIVLSMQKLWRRYIYASGYSVDNLNVDFDDAAKYDPYLLPMLSTECTELISGSMNMRRSDKVKYIADDKIAQSNLYVCLKEQIINNLKNENNYYGSYLNCGQCKKCLRTMLQLEILGKLDKFRGIFDSEKWPERREHYIAKVIAEKDKNLMFRNLYESMLENNYPIPKIPEPPKKTLFSRIESKLRDYYRRFKRRLGI